MMGDETLGMKGISGGQRRRVGIGLELVKDPRLVFLDEPTSGLDSEMASQVMEILQRLARKDRLVRPQLHQMLASSCCRGCPACACRTLWTTITLSGCCPAGGVHHPSAEQRHH